MAELGELAAVLAAAGNNSSQARAMQSLFNPQPNSLETGLGLEATRNPIAALYYQAARNERMRGSAMSPQALQAVQAAQQRDFELQKLEAIAGPLATIAGHSPATIQGTMDTFGVPLNNKLFELEQVLNALDTRAGAASELGSAVQSSAAGGGDFNDILSQLDFNSIGRTTPTSVQSAAAGKADPTYKGPKLGYTGYQNGVNVTLDDVPVGSGMTLDQAREHMGLGDPPTISGASGTPSPQTPPPDVVATFNRVVPRHGYTPASDIQLLGNDAQGRPIFGQRVVRGGQEDILVSAYDSMGQLRITPQSRTTGNQ